MRRLSTGSSLTRRIFFALPIGSARIGGLLILLVAVVLACLSTTIAKKPTLRPELVLLVIVYEALEHELVPALVMTLLVGYVGDVLSGNLRGLYLFSAVMTFFLVRALAFRVAGRRALVVTALGLMATLFHLAVMFFVEHLLGPGMSSIVAMSPAFASQILGAILLSYPIYLVLARIESRLRPRPDVVIGRKRR